MVSNNACAESVLIIVVYVKLTKIVIQEIQNRVKPALVTIPIINSLYYGLCILVYHYLSYK
jgi:hypothetical protein